jgi:hypothetical protein
LDFSFFLKMEKKKKKPPPPLPPRLRRKSRRAQRIEVEIGLNLDETTGKEEGKECQPHTDRPQTQGDFLPTKL